MVYDTHGVFSSPRGWHTLRAFGHPDVTVLQGGLPAWLSEGYDCHSDSDPIEPPPRAPLEVWTLRTASQWSMKMVQANINHPSHQHIDLRPAGRFTGEVPEPREGMRSGHVPNSSNLPFMELLTRDGPEGELLQLKPVAELVEILEKAGVTTGSPPGRPIMASCGSGMTAAHLALAVEVAYPGSEHVGIYDGSWTEWGGEAGTAQGMPVVKGK